MNPSEAEKTIRTNIVVTPQKVTVAKAIILELTKDTFATDALIEGVLAANSIVQPVVVTLHELGEPQSAIAALGHALSWRLAASEGIWSLIHSGLLFPVGEAREQGLRVQWTTISPVGGGGQSSSWDFDDCRLPLPPRVRRAPSLGGAANQFLSDPDLYLSVLGIEGMHEEIESAFREAVKCFRLELFTAALAMLGKASEGAWLELGEALVDAVPEEHSGKFAKQKASLEDPALGVLKKVEAVNTLYCQQDVFGSLVKISGVRPQELKLVTVWSDAVRDSRNVIHFGVQASMRNTYEKLAALLIAAVPNIKTLYSVRAAARAMSVSRGELG